MNQILLTQKKASKCRKKIERRQQRRELRRLRINKFKLILKNTLKATFRFILKAICVILFKSIFNVGLLVPSIFKKFFGLVSNIKLKKLKKPEKRIQYTSFKEKTKYEKTEQKYEKPVFNANVKTKQKSKKIEKTIPRNSFKIGVALKNTAGRIRNLFISILTLFKKLGKLILSAILKLVSILKGLGKLILNYILKAKIAFINLEKLISKIVAKIKSTTRKVKNILAYAKYIIVKRNVRKEKTEEVTVKPMNQILISGETALIKPIKTTGILVYKVGFVFSLICSLTFGGLSAYATYDRNKGEEISKNILANIVVANPTNTINVSNTQTIVKKITSERIKILDDAIVVILNKETEEPKINIEYLANEASKEIKEKKFIEVSLAENGETYYVIATISIPKINVNYPVLSETSDTLLKISPCKYWGGDVNEVGNLCIMGHNYVNSQFFSKVPNLANGDIIELTDIEGNTMKYSVYDKFTIADDDMSCTSQMTDGNIDITLITCTNNGKKRVVVKARTIEE